VYSSASGCDLREVVTSGFACRRAMSTVLSGSPDYESGALLRCRSHSDAAWRYDRDRAVFVRLTLALVVHMSNGGVSPMRAKRFVRKASDISNA